MLMESMSTLLPADSSSERMKKNHRVERIKIAVKRARASVLARQVLAGTFWQ